MVTSFSFPKICAIDINKVKEIYDYWGFGEKKETTPQEYPTFETKTLGGFASFFISSSEYIKESGKIQFINIGGIVTEDAYSNRQNVILTVTFPDGHEEERMSMALENRQFSFQIRVDDSVPIGEYTIDAKIRNFDSPTLSFEILDATSKPAPKSIPKPIPEPKESISIPDWVKNNVKWWSEGAIDDESFISGIQYLVKEKLIDVPITQKTVKESNDIPLWIRTNAAWWADGQITDSDFVKGIEFLANSGIIKVK
jgi:hypothetical protein